jgi:hypothetical protein
MASKSLVPIIKMPGTSVIPAFPTEGHVIFHWLWKIHQYLPNTFILVLVGFLSLKTES